MQASQQYAWQPLNAFISGVGGGNAGFGGASSGGRRSSADASIGDRDDDVDELTDGPLELQPKFTEQDEKRDLASLTIQDVVKLQADLTGMEAVTAGMSGLNMNGGDTCTTTTTAAGSNLAQDYASLAAMDLEMAKLPPSSTSAYCQALIKCPAEVSVERRKAFLECEDGNPKLAARRLAKYWQLRLDLFGSEKCFLTMTLTGAMADEMMPMAERRMYQLLPCTDGAGRAIQYCRISNRDSSTYSLKQELMSQFYLAEIVAANESARKRGMVLLIDGRDVTRKHFHRKLPKYVRLVFDSVFPIRLKAAHMCFPSNVLFYIVHPIVKRFMAKRVRLRIKMHPGSVSDVLRSLAGYIT